MNDIHKHHTWKAHLTTLPPVKQFPKWQGESRNACFLIPVFSLADSTKYVKQYIAKSAAWALKMWKENTDARKLNIPCYIYLEKQVAPVAIPILEANQVSKKHIIVADYDNTAWVSKCLQPVFDTSLEKYEYVVVADVDVFPLKGSDNTVLPIFKQIQKHRPTGFGCKVFHEFIPVYWMSRLADLYRHKEGLPLQRDLIDVWCEALETVTGEELRKHIDGGIGDDRPWTGLMIFDQSTFQDKEWLEKVCNVFGDDEAVMYAWSRCSKNNTLWDVEDIDIELFTDIFSYLLKCHEVYEDSLNTFMMTDAAYKNPCLVHHHMSVDHKFKTMIGSV